MRPTALALEVLLWWAVAFAVWMISLSTAPLQEYLLGAGCSLLCGVTAVGARTASRERWHLSLRWFAPALLFPAALVSDAAQVLVASLGQLFGGRAAGRFIRVPTAYRGADPEDRSARAVSVALISLTPGTFVVDVDPADGTLVVHQLGGRGPQMTRAVRSA